MAQTPTKPYASGAFEGTTVTRTGELVDLPTPDRPTQGYLAFPPGQRGHGLLLLSEWWGLVDHIKDVADRFAAAGFVTLAPDLYHGERTTRPDEAGRLMMALDIAKTSSELRIAADHLLARPEVTPKKLGVVGFCMGGQLAVYAACEHPELFGGCVNFYGIHPNVKLQPEKIDCRVLAHFGKHDQSVNAAAAKTLIDAFEAADKRIEPHFYDAGHAFFNDARPDVYDASSARIAFDRTVEFLRAELE